MPTIQADTVTDRVTYGDAIVAAAKDVSVTAIRRRYTAFGAAHRAYCAAATATTRALDAVHARQHAISELDVDQDHAVEALAVALAGDGLPRTHPFKAFGALAPSKLCELGDVEEAKACLVLVARVRKRKGISAATKKAATALERSAKGILSAAKPVAALSKAHHTAIARRDALGQKWSNAFSALKRAARSAEDDGHVGLYSALFVRERVAPAKKKRATKAGAAGTTGAAGAGEAGK